MDYKDFLYYFENKKSPCKTGAKTQHKGIAGTVLQQIDQSQMHVPDLVGANQRSVFNRDHRYEFGFR